jgi:type I restriction enzyme, R subunit
LDRIENLTLYDEAKDGLVKITGKNHQFLGVNNAIDALEQIKANQGRPGVSFMFADSPPSHSPPHPAVRTEAG